MKGLLVTVAALAFAGWTFLGSAQGSSHAVALPAPAQDLAAPGAAEATAVFAGGCFWGVQAVFQHTRGVLGAVSGYAGGTPGTARYELVSTGRTQHAEAVQVRYDPRQVSYGQLLQVFFSVAHDPTTWDRQGPDHGPQYRSAIFVGSEAERAVAARYIAQLDAAKLFPSAIVTRLEPLTAFHRAEAYHQDYATMHPHQPYIVMHDKPKLANLKALLPQRWREVPVLVGGSR